MKSKIDWYISEKYIDLLLYLEHKSEHTEVNFDFTESLQGTEEPITLKKWIKYRLVHSRFKQCRIGQVMLSLKRKLGIKFY